MRQKNDRGRKRSLLITERVECGRFRRVIDRRGWMLTEAITMLASLSHVCHELNSSDGRQDTDHPRIDGQQEQPCGQSLPVHLGSTDVTREAEIALVPRTT